MVKKNRKPHADIDSYELANIGWYYKNSNDETYEFGLLLPNELGFYDMRGNGFDDWEGRFEQIMQLNQLTQFADMTLMLLMG